MPNKYKKDLLTALEILEVTAEESGSYGENRKREIEAVQLLKEFINNRI